MLCTADIPLQKPSPASTPPPSENDADENEEIRLDFEHLDDAVLTLPQPPLVTIPEPSPFCPNIRKHEKLHSDKPHITTFAPANRAEMEYENNHTWSLGYFTALSSGRGDLWRARSSSEPMCEIAKDGNGNVVNHVGGHACGVLFWGW